MGFFDLRPVTRVGSRPLGYTNLRPPSPHPAPPPWEEDGFVLVSAITVTSDGATWIASYDSGVSRFDGESWRVYTAADGLASNWVNTIAADPNGALWFGTRYGVSRFNDGIWTTYTTDDSLAGEWIYAIAIAPDGAVWFGTHGGGVARFDGESWTT